MRPALTLVAKLVGVVAGTSDSKARRGKETLDGLHNGIDEDKDG